MWFSQGNLNLQKTTPNCLFGGKNLGGDLGYGELLLHLFLVEETLIPVRRDILKLKKIRDFPCGGKWFA